MWVTLRENTARYQVSTPPPSASEPSDDGEWHDQGDFYRAPPGAEDLEPERADEHPAELDQ